MMDPREAAIAVLREEAAYMRQRFEALRARFRAAHRAPDSN